MTNLIGMFIVAWDGNALSVLNVEQPVVSPIVHQPSTEEQVYIPMDTAATILHGLVTPPLDQDINRVFVNTLLIISVISLQHISKTLFQLWSQTSVLCEDNLEWDMIYMDVMVKYTHHQVQQLDPAVIKPASSKAMENNKKGANVSVSLCIGLTVRSDVNAEGVGVAHWPGPFKCMS